MRVLEGKLVDSGIKVGIVAARFNEFIVSKLVAGAKDGLVRHDVSEENIDLAWVPGAFEIPLIASKMAKSGKYDAVICLGAVIRGATSHYDYVCSEVSKGIANVSLASDIPVMFGVLTTDTIEQAIERAGTKAGNKGFECAEGAIEMVNLIKEIEGITFVNPGSLTHPRQMGRLPSFVIMDIDDNGEAHFTINYLEDNEIVQRPGQQISEWGMQRQ